MREEHERCERLEEQLNDLTELHQHEVENIKSGTAAMSMPISSCHSSMVSMAAYYQGSPGSNPGKGEN